MSHKPLITVFGVAGAQGGSLARALLQAADRPFRVRIVTRHPGSTAAQALAEQGAEICAADIEDPASVQRAMQAAQGALCFSEVQHAAVRHVIRSVLQSEEPSGEQA